MHILYVHVCVCLHGEFLQLVLLGHHAAKHPHCFQMEAA